MSYQRGLAMKNGGKVGGPLQWLLPYLSIPL